jgi:2,3-bisphosphoglycerate-dependent phosphoglycerate mutase
VEILLMRHGAADPVLEGSTGPADPPLSGLGREQALRLADWYAGDGLAAVLTSPLRRAAETAAILAQRLGTVIVSRDDLVEYDRWSATYIPRHLVDRNDPEYRLMVEHGTYSTPEGGEQPEHFRTRAVAAVERVVAAYPGARVAVISHGGLINAYLGHILGITRLLWFEPENTSVSRVAASRSGIRSVLSVNETGHLVGRRGS